MLCQAVQWSISFRPEIPEKADKGWIGAFEELVIRVQCKISNTGKALETGQSSDRKVGGRQIITSYEEVQIRLQRVSG